MKFQTLGLSALSLSLLAPLCAHADEPTKVAILPDTTWLLPALPSSSLAKGLDPIIIGPKKEFTYSMPVGPVPQTNDPINLPKPSEPLPLYNFRLAPGDQLQPQLHLAPIPPGPPLLKDLPQLGRLFIVPRGLPDAPQSYSIVPIPAAPTNGTTDKSK